MVLSIEQDSINVYSKLIPKTTIVSGIRKESNYLFFSLSKYRYSFILPPILTHIGINFRKYVELNL